MKTHKEVLVDGSDFLISLKKMLGKNVKDIEGYLTTEFGDPVFKLCSIKFEDGTELGCEGEHDLPYLVQSHRENEERPEYKGKYCAEYSDENLESILETDPDRDDE